MTKPVTIKDALDAAVKALNCGNPMLASQISLQILQHQPDNHDAMTILGAARFAVLCNPHDVFFMKLKSLGYSPKSAVDIGAYQGEWTKALKRVFPETHALMIEAQPDKMSHLEKVCGSLSSVDFRICLVGARNANNIPFHLMDTPFGSTGSSIYPEQTNFKRDVVLLPMRTLDELLADAKINPDLLKIDVQGAELDVLSGGARTLSRVEFIHMELSVLQYNEGAPLIAEVLPRLKELGFVLFDILEEHRIADDILTQVDALFIRESSKFRPTGVLF